MGRAIPCGNRAVPQLEPAAGAVTSLSQAATGECALLGALGTNHSVGTAEVSQQLPLPWATPGAEGTPAGLGGQVPYFHHARNPERFLYLIPLVGVEVVDGSVLLCFTSSLSGRGVLSLLLVHSPSKEQKSPVSFFLPSPRQGIPAPGILHILSSGSTCPDILSLLFLQRLHCSGALR